MDFCYLYFYMHFYKSKTEKIKKISLYKYPYNVYKRDSLCGWCCF